MKSKKFYLKMGLLITLSTATLFAFQNCAPAKNQQDDQASSVNNTNSTPAPVAVKTSYEFKSLVNTAIELKLRSTLNIKNDSAVTIAVVEQPLYGQLQKRNEPYIDWDLFNYTPNLGFSGRDKFKVAVFGLPEYAGKLIEFSMVVQLSETLVFKASKVTTYVDNYSPNITVGQCAGVRIKREGPDGYLNKTIQLNQIRVVNGPDTLVAYSDYNCSTSLTSDEMLINQDTITVYVKPTKIAFLSLDFSVDGQAYTAQSSISIQMGQITNYSIDLSSSGNQGQCFGPIKISGSDNYGNTYSQSDVLNVIGYTDTGFTSDHFKFYSDSSCSNAIAHSVFTNNNYQRRPFWPITSGSMYVKSNLSGSSLTISLIKKAYYPNTKIYSVKYLNLTDKGLSIPKPSLNSSYCDEYGDPVSSNVFGVVVNSTTEAVLATISSQVATLPSCYSSSNFYAIRDQYVSGSKVVFNPDAYIPRQENVQQTIYIRVCTADSNKRIFGADQVIKMTYTPTTTYVGPLQEKVIGYSKRSCSIVY